MTWLPNARVVDLTGRSNGAGNGPFGPGQFYGVVLHCNGGVGLDTPDSYFAGGGGPDSVCPNFQVHADGSISQYLPLEWSPWCQADGNTNYAAIETAGGPDPLTAAQVASVASIVRAYHQVLGMPLQLAEGPGERGLGYHAMGGAGWGGHPCPLPARIAQRGQILQLAGAESTDSNGAIQIGDDSMSAAEVAQILNHIDAIGPKISAGTTALANQINAVAKNQTAAIHSDNVKTFGPTIDRVSHMYGQLEQIAADLTAVGQQTGTAVDLAPVLAKIDTLSKHLGA